MAYSTLFSLSSSQLTSEPEVETRLLAEIFKDLGYPVDAVIPKSGVAPLKINDGIKSAMKQVDFLLKDKNGIPRIVVEAKDPSINVLDAWGQAASYALSYNRDKDNDKRIEWLLISNGFVTALFPHDKNTPAVSLQLSDFARGLPPYVSLRTYIEYDAISPRRPSGIKFEPLPPQRLNQLFADSHNLVWKKEKLAPADAFFEFCKFIFIKIQEDKKREKTAPETPPFAIPLTEEWLEIQQKTSSHPVRDILFTKLQRELEDDIIKHKGKRIFEKNETLKLSAATCKYLIKTFQNVNLSSIDEDLNGRMFEVFLAASIRGKDLGQFFTPRSVVDFMTRIALRNIDIANPPKVLDACCGTAGFLIEVMTYLIEILRDDTRLTDIQKNNLKNKIFNECLYGVEANERVSRIARINMFLHGEQGSHIFHSDGLDTDLQELPDMTGEQKDEVREYQDKINNNLFDIILTNPPFSMKYDAAKPDEKRIIEQHDLASCLSTVKSSILFLDRYYNLLRPGGEMLIILDDTVINGKTFLSTRKWLVEKFIIMGIHSLPFNAFFKANANIKTSILHLRKKISPEERQPHIFMSVANNIGHDNSLRDTPFRNNLTEILIAYLEWQRTGLLCPTINDNTVPDENLEGPMQYWLASPDDITPERLDTFFYCPELDNTWEKMENASTDREIELINASTLKIRKKLSSQEKISLRQNDKTYKYIEISDVTKYGLITHYTQDIFVNLPTRGEYQIHAGDILLALNNCSRGTVVLVPDEFDNAICTSGFLVIVPRDKEEGLLLWYSLRSDMCKKQIYYLAQTASQPELKIEAWNKYFKIPLPAGQKKKEALEKAREYYAYLGKLAHIDEYRLIL